MEVGKILRFSDIFYDASIAALQLKSSESLALHPTAIGLDEAFSLPFEKYISYAYDSIH